MLERIRDADGTRSSWRIRPDGKESFMKSARPTGRSLSLRKPHVDLGAVIPPSIVLTLASPSHFSSLPQARSWGVTWGVESVGGSGSAERATARIKVKQSHRRSRGSRRQFHEGRRNRYCFVIFATSVWKFFFCALTCWQKSRGFNSIWHTFQTALASKALS
jgi:hypothetical protein